MKLSIHIDPKDATPLYAQLERGIRLAIATGALVQGDQLPTVRQLAVDLRVNANTVARVYLALEHDGVLETKRGVGTFIAAPPPATGRTDHRLRKLLDLIDRFLTDTTSLGYTSSEVLESLGRRINKGEPS